MIKIPSSTNKSEKEREEVEGVGGGREWRLSLALSLSSVGRSNNDGGSGERRTWEPSEDVDTSPWLCHHLS